MIRTQAQQTHTHTWIRREDLALLKKYSSSTGLSLCDTLHNLINGQDHRALTMVNLHPQDFAFLQQRKEDAGFTDIGWVIHNLIESQSSIEIVTPSKVLNERYPISIVGRSGVGKSFWLKNSFLKKSFNSSTKDNPVSEYAVLVIDTNNEYDMLKEIKSIRELNLASNEKVRFCPVQPSLMCVMMVRQLFTEMNSLIDMNKDALNNLVLIVEEAQSFKSSSGLMAFFIEVAILCEK